MAQSASVSWGDVKVSTRLRWILPWTISAEALLAKGSEILDPWVILFQFTDPDLSEALTRLKSRKEDAALFRILGGMRYRKNRSKWISLLGRIESMISRETMRESLAVQEWLDEGRVEGRMEGKVEGERSALITLLETRFPPLGLDEAIQSINDLDALTKLIRLAGKTRSSISVVKAIEACASPNQSE